MSGFAAMKRSENGRISYGLERYRSAFVALKLCAICARPLGMVNRGSKIDANGCDCERISAVRDF